jgi:hypothetical protein
VWVSREEPFYDGVAKTVEDFPSRVGYGSRR